MRIVLHSNLNLSCSHTKKSNLAQICVQHVVLLVALNVKSTAITACMSTAVTNTVCAL